jgi:hypothetical protein
MMDLLAFSFIVGAGIGSVSVAKAYLQANLRSHLVAYRLSFPRDLEADNVVTAFSALSGLLLPWWQRWHSTPHVILETHASSSGIEHFVLAPTRYSSTIENVLQSALPSVRYEPVEVPLVETHRGVEYRLTSNDRPLSVDPTAMSLGLLSTLQPLTKDERIVVQWIVAPHPPVAPIKQQLAAANTFLTQSEQPDGDAVSALRSKQEHALLLATGRIGVVGTSNGAEFAMLRRVESAWHVARAPGVHLKRRFLTKTRVAKSIDSRRAPGSAWPGRLNAEELAGFSGWPIGVIGLPGLSLGGCRQIPSSPSIPRTGTVVCDSTFPGDARPLALSVEARLRHVHVLGPTGVGKSNLLSQMVIDDMEAGRGVVLLDPKGDLVTTILERIPEHRRGDVIVFDPADTAQPLGLNPLRSAHGVSAEVVVENLVGMFKSLYSYSWGPRLDDILRAALLTLADVEGATLCEVPLILTNASYRRKIVGKLDDPVGLESFWGWYEGLSDAERQTAIGPVLNKIRAFTGRPTVRAIIGQSQPAVQMRDVLAEGKILLCSLASGMLGDEAAALMGALIVSELWHATKARSGLSAEQRKPVMAYLDEWQNFVHLPTPMASVLAEARGLGLGMTLAHQHMDQLTPEAKHAVLANARSRVLFQLAAGDARLMARELGTMLTADDLQGLGAYEVVAQLYAKGTTQAPATGRTRALDAPPSDPTTIRSWSRQRYGVPRDEVEQAIRERQVGTATGAIGRKPRSGGAS